MKLFFKKVLMRLGFKFRAKCGHKSGRHINGKVAGHPITAQVAIRKDGSIPICNHCFVKLSIPCGWCGLPIVLGDPVTLYKPKPGYVPPEGHRTHGEAVVGCLRTTCARGFDRSGFWLPTDNLKEAHVYVVQSPMQIFMSIMFGANPLENQDNKPHDRETGLLSKIVKPPHPNCN